MESGSSYCLSGNVYVGTVSGTSISFGTPVVLLMVLIYWNCNKYSTNQKVVIAYRDGGNKLWNSNCRW